MNTIRTYYARQLRARPAGRFFLFCMNAFLMGAIVTWTLVGTVLFPLILLVSVVGLRRSPAWAARWSIWFYGRVWQAFSRPFVRFEPIEFDPTQFKTPGILVVNHRSFFDTYCMNMLPVCDICFAVRNWPFRIPVYHIFMNLARYINIEKTPWDQCVARARETLDNGGFVLVFPEGHRSRGSAMTRFYSGAFKMAVETGAPIIPVCLTGTQDLLPPDRRYMAPAHIRTRVLDPVYPGDLDHDGPVELRHQTLKKTVKARMAAVLADMDAQG